MPNNEKKSLSEIKSEIKIAMDNEGIRFMYPTEGGKTIVSEVINDRMSLSEVEGIMTKMVKDVSTFLNN